MKIKRKNKKRKTIKKYKLKKRFKRGRGFWANLADGLKKAYGYY